MSNSLSPNNATSYLGVRATTPANMIVMQRAPTQNDVIGYLLGTQWLHWDKNNPSNSIQYVLTGVAQNVATWVALHGGADNPTLPNHSVALGIGTPGLSSTAPIATLGAPLISNGANVDPSFGVATVSGGGTGINDCVPYAVYCGGTTGEGPVQQVAGLGTATQVLTSNGNGLLPTWQAAGGGGGGNGGPIAVQVFSSSGVYTPSANLGSCIVECIGGGGGGGSITVDTGGGGGGGSGGYTRKLFLAADVLPTITVTIGAGGAADVNGGNSTFGALLTGSGGIAGAAGPDGIGGLGGAASGGDINIVGGAGGSGCNAAASDASPAGLSGFGGSNLYGAGGLGYANAATDSVGQAGNVYGSGGSGAVRQSAGSSVGGAGANGIIIVTEFGPYSPTPPSSPISINTIVYDTPGADTYTPSSGMFQVQVECVGGGGGGTSPTTQGVFVASGAGGGAYCKKLFTSAEIGASQAFVVGAGGLGGAAGLPTGQLGFDGGDSTFGSFLVAGGGKATTALNDNSVSGLGGIASGGNINISGQDGSSAWGTDEVSVYGTGGASGMGFGSSSAMVFSVVSGSLYGIVNGNLYGGGASGFVGSPAVPTAGPIGGSGVIIITEYIA